MSYLLTCHPKMPTACHERMVTLTSLFFTSPTRWWGKCKCGLTMLGGGDMVYLLCHVCGHPHRQNPCGMTGIIWLAHGRSRFIFFLFFLNFDFWRGPGWPYNSWSFAASVSRVLDYSVCSHTQQKPFSIEGYLVPFPRHNSLLICLLCQNIFCSFNLTVMIPFPTWFHSNELNLPHCLWVC